MKNKRIYNIASEFTIAPAGRKKPEGDFTGEHFREILIKLLEDNQTLEIDLTGLKMTGTSFFEESFGGLIRHGFFNEKELKEKLTITGDKAFLIKEVLFYIDDAAKEFSLKKNKR